MKIFIVEDNSRHMNLLKAKAESLNYEVVGTCQHAAKTIFKIKKNVSGHSSFRHQLGQR